MKRPHIPLKVKLEAALYQLGLDLKTAELHHTPPLAMRIQEHHTGLYHPDANDPRCMVWLSKSAHALQTTGRRGTSKLSKRGGDISEIAKTKRLEKKYGTPITMEDYILNPMVRKHFPTLKRKWPSRPFPKRSKT